MWPGGQPEQPEQHGGGQHDRDNGGHQVCDGVWDGGVGGVEVGGKTGVLARIRDGYGITQQKRRYWKRKSSVPDGLVQRRISQFSVVVQNLGGGGISAKPMNDRKRKWQGPTADDV